ncbi:hypothetical protein F5Y10DRAFT_270403 [Nemania abortiva]|nr:hypothetical protein F5Y10DRAFT_270403 [Nemania abortiva]
MKYTHSPNFITPPPSGWAFVTHSPVSQLQTIFSPQTTLIMTLLLRILIELSVLVKEVGILLMFYVWDIFLSYPAYLALVSLGWAMGPFQADAVDLYLSVEI